MLMIMLHRENYLKQDKFTFTHNKLVTIYIVYEMILWSNIQGADFTLGNSLFGDVKLTQNAHPDLISINILAFDTCGSILLLDGDEFGKNVIIFSGDTSSSIHIDNMKKDILILGEGPVDDLKNTMLTTEKKYFINFTEQHKKLCLTCFHCNGANSYTFVESVEIYNNFEIHKFKAP